MNNEGTANPLTTSERGLAAPRVHLALGQARELIDADGAPLGVIKLESYRRIDEGLTADGSKLAGEPEPEIQLLVADTAFYHWKLQKPGEAQQVRWSKGYKLTLLDHDPQSSTVDLSIEALSGEAPEVIASKIRVDRGKSLSFGEDYVMRFGGHSHMSMGRGDSPLMIELRYSHGVETEDVVEKLYPPKTSWFYRDYQFQLLAHEYDSFMVLDIRRLKLRRVTVVAPGAASGTSKGAMTKPPYPAFLSEAMMASLPACLRWTVAAIRCEEIEISARGSRSQSMSLRASVLATEPGSVASPFVIASQYVGGDVFMEAGREYIAVLCQSDDVEVPWSVISWRPRAHADAESDRLQALADIQAGARARE